MAQYFKQYSSASQILAVTSPVPLVASAPDGNGKLIAFISKAGRKSYLTQGKAPFRLGASPLGGRAII